MLSQDTVSVHRPSFYAERFFKFMSSTVFRKSSCEPPPAGGTQGQGPQLGTGQIWVHLPAPVRGSPRDPGLEKGRP